MFKKIAPDKKQLGQTLIETLVAIFILVIGLISALGLAISSFQATDASTKQIIGTALARQGVEAVKNIRDSNWQGGTLTDCSATMTAGQFCFAGWLGSGSHALNNGTYAVKFNPIATSQPWSLLSTATYVLNYDPTTGIYDVNGVGPNSIFSRNVTITQNTAAPFSLANPELKIVSTVWWTERTFGAARSCPVTTNPATLPMSCKVMLEMHLTNWRNFQ